MQSLSENLAIPEPDQKSPKLPSLEPSDPEIDSITKLLDRTLKLQTRALSTSKLVAVDKKYSLSSASTASKFYKWQRYANIINKRQRDKGIVKKFPEGNRIGYRPQELMWNGALHLKDCRPSNLTNEIHSLLGRNRFDDCPDHIYDQFIPALQLATLFLTKPICFQFWVTVALGKRKFDEEGSRIYGYTTERIEKNVPMTEENTSYLINYIKELDQSTLVHFCFKPALTLGEHGVWAVAQEICDYWVEQPQKPFPGIRRHNVRLHGDFYIAAQRLAQLTHPDPAQQLRFHFFLAVIILHELAHVVEGAHRGVQPGPNPMLEPFLFDHGVKELGAAWESMMFGGRIQPINGKVDGIDGLSVNSWPGGDDPDLDFERPIYYSIPMAYIESMFQMQNWEREYDLKNWKQFHIPRTGAVATYLNCFTTMPWKEELGEITDTIAEDLSLSDPDEPAPKRRKTRPESLVFAIKGHDKKGKSDCYSKAIEPTPPNRRRIRSPANSSAAVVHRNLQATKTQQEKANVRKRERGLKTRQKDKVIHNATHKLQDPSRHSIRQAGKTLIAEEIRGERQPPSPNNQASQWSTSKNPSEFKNPTKEETRRESQPPSPNRRNSRWRMSQSPYEFSHPRIWGLKRAANADSFRPETWPDLNSARVGR